MRSSYHFVQASLGDTIEVPTLDGKVEMKIPAGIQSGTIMRLKGKGIPSFAVLVVAINMFALKF